MNGQGSNRILPIKSLLENLKQESKKQYLQLDIKSGVGNPHQNNQINGSVTQRQHLPIDMPPSLTARDQKKGISLNKNNDRTHHLPYSSKELPQNAEQGFNFYVPKKDRNNGERANRFGNQLQQSFKMEMQTDHYGFGNKNNKTEQVIYHQVKHDIKVGSKNCDTTVKFTEEYDKESSTLTEKFNSKFQEETRSYSKFEKMESQPIFKDELTKIKTQLFHKEAMLFTKTQEIEEKDKMISELQTKLQIKEKKGVSLEFIEKIKCMEVTVKAQSNQIDFLRKELEQRKELYNKYEQDTATNYTLINLKIRQYQAEEREKSFQISEMKEKQKKKYQVQDKTIRALKQILKEREDAFKQAKQQATFNENKAEALQALLKEKEKEFSKQIDVKETFIRELSAEIGDLKSNLKNMEERIRQMIDEQSEMKEISKKFNETKMLYQEKERLNQGNISELKSKISELNEIVFKRESSLIAYKQKNIELQEKIKKLTQPSRANSPPKSSTSTSKLIKDNQRLSAIAKDFDRRLYQSIKLNQSLNEEMVKRELIILNASCISRLGKNVE